MSKIRELKVTLSAEEIIRLVVINQNDYHLDDSVSNWVEGLFPDLNWPDYKQAYYDALQERRDEEG